MDDEIEVEDAESSEQRDLGDGQDDDETTRAKISIAFYYTPAIRLVLHIAIYFFSKMRLKYHWPSLQIQHPNIHPL